MTMTMTMIDQSTSRSRRTNSRVREDRKFGETCVSAWRAGLRECGRSKSVGWAWGSHPILGATLQPSAAAREDP